MMQRLLLAAAIALAGCSELPQRQSDSGGHTEGPAAFNAPAKQSLVFSDRAPGRLMGFRIDSEITAGQRQAREIVITIPAAYQFNGFDALGPAGTRIGVYGFDFNPSSPGPDRLFPIYVIDNDSAWVDSNLDGQTNPLKPQVEYSLDAQQNHVITIILPRGGDGSTSSSTAGFTSDIMASLRTGIFSNPATGGSYPMTLNFTSVDPDTGDADDNAGSPPEQFALNDNALIAPATLSAAVLPSSRSVAYERTATAFATIVNGGQTAAENCAISLLNVIKVGFSYRTTDPNTNAPTGTVNTPVNIPAGQSQSFVITVRPEEEFFNAPIPFTTEPLEFLFSCSTGQAIQLPGVNQLLFSSGSGQPADVISVAATTTNDGILFLGGPSASGAIGLAAVNIGTTDTLTVRRGSHAAPGAQTAGLDFFVCQTMPGSANPSQCVSPPVRDSLTTAFDQNTVMTFTLIVRGTGSAVANDPARNRVFIEFVDGEGVVRGSTSVAVTTNAAPA